MPGLTALETTCGALTANTRVFYMTLGLWRRLTTYCDTLTCEYEGLTMKFLPLYSRLFLGAVALADDGEGPFCFCWKDDRLALLFLYPDSFPILTILFLNSSLSLSWSSSTYCTCIINLVVSMSPVNIATLLSLLDRQVNLATNKLILLLISTTIF